MPQFLITINDLAPLLGVMVAVIPVAWGAFQYIRVKRVETKQLRFENYHRLIKELVEGGNGQGSIFLDRQLAVVFELQDYKEYAPASRRILKGFRCVVENWTGDGKARLIEQIDETLSKL